MIDPILPRASAPDHRPGFWEDLDASMVGPTEALPAVSTDRPEPGSVRVDERDDAMVVDLSKSPERRLWPLVAAAALLVVVGLAVFLRPGSGDPDGPTELVVAPAADDAEPAPDAPLAGGDDGADDTSTGTGDTDGPGEADRGSSGAEDASADSDSAASADGADGPGEAAPTVESEAPLVTYPAAPGNDDVEVWLPDRPMPDGTRFLATWEQAGLSWFGLVDPSQSCRDDRYSRLVHVNAAGLAQPVADHQPGFSGAVSHFTLSPSSTRVAFLIACEGQLEFYVARLAPTSGELIDLRLAWVGTGSESSAFVLWDGDTVSLNGIDGSGRSFYVDVDPVAGRVDGTGLPPEPEPVRYPWIVGATAGGEFTYWNVLAGGTCNGEVLYQRSSDGRWQPALAESVDAGGVTAFDIDRGSSQVAFADACPGINPGIDNGRFFLGTLRADGLISSVRTIDLSAFATGHVSMLDWIDGQTLRIHTDESVTGGTVLRFDYRFDDGRDAGVLVQVD